MPAAGGSRAACSAAPRGVAPVAAAASERRDRPAAASGAHARGRRAWRLAAAPPVGDGDAAPAGPSEPPQAQLGGRAREGGASSSAPGAGVASAGARPAAPRSRGGAEATADAVPSRGSPWALPELVRGAGLRVLFGDGGVGDAVGGGSASGALAALDAQLVAELAGSRAAAAALLRRLEQEIWGEVTSFPADKLPARRVASQAMFVRVPWLPDAGAAAPAWAPPGWGAGSARLALRSALMAANALAVAANLSRQPRPRRGGLLCLLPGAAESGDNADPGGASFGDAVRALTWPDAPFAVGSYAELDTLPAAPSSPGAVLLFALAPAADAPPECGGGGTDEAAVVAALDSLLAARVPFVFCTLFRDAPAAAQPNAPPAPPEPSPRAVAEASTRALLARLRPLPTAGDAPRAPAASPADELVAATVAAQASVPRLEAAIAAAEAEALTGGPDMSESLAAARARLDAARVEAALVAALAGDDAKSGSALPRLRSALRAARDLAAAAPPLSKAVAAELNALAQRAAGRVEALRSVARARTQLEEALAPHAAAATGAATPPQMAALVEALDSCRACAWPWQLAAEAAAAETVLRRWRALAALADAASGDDAARLAASLRTVAAAYPDADVAAAARRLAELEAEAALSKGDTRLCAYRDACATAWADGAVSSEGAAILAGLRRSLRVTPVEHETALRLSGATAAIAAAAAAANATAISSLAEAEAEAAADAADDARIGSQLLAALPDAESLAGGDGDDGAGGGASAAEAASAQQQPPGVWRHVGGGVSYNEEDVLGVGSRGTYVFRGVVRRTRRAQHPAAVKRVVRPPGPAGRRLVELVEREVELLAALNQSPRVTFFHGWCLTDAHVFIATELCPESLEQHCARQPRLPLQHRLRLMREAAEGVAWLHDASKPQGAVAHNDLKPANILVAADGGIKIADVGLGVRLSEAAAAADADVDADNGGGSGDAGGGAYSLSTFRQYGVELNLSGRAPEVLAQQRLTPAADVWSLACVFYFVLTGAHSPFGRTAEEADAAIRAGRFELSALMALRGAPRAALEARHLLAAMLAPSPAERPTAAAVLQHPLFWSADAALQAAKALHDAGGDPDAALLMAAVSRPASGASAGSAAERSALLAAACCDLHGWQARMDGALLARMHDYAGGTPYADGFAGLLRFARNAYEHPPVGAELAPLVSALHEAGGAPPGLRRARSVAARRGLLAEYLLVLFPSLAIACYECFDGAVPPSVLAAAATASPPPQKQRQQPARNKRASKSSRDADALAV